MAPADFFKTYDHRRYVGVMGGHALQEIFQEAVQNHYLTFGFASPMIFLGKRFWTEDIPVYPLIEHLMETGKYKNLLLTLTDDIEEVVATLQAFSRRKGQCGALLP